MRLCDQRTRCASRHQRTASWRTASLQERLRSRGSWSSASTFAEQLRDVQTLRSRTLRQDTIAALLSVALRPRKSLLVLLTSVDVQRQLRACALTPVLTFDAQILIEKTLSAVPGIDDTFYLKHTPPRARLKITRWADARYLQLRIKAARNVSDFSGGNDVLLVAAVGGQKSRINAAFKVHCPQF